MRQPEKPRSGAWKRCLLPLPALLILLSCTNAQLANLIFVHFQPGALPHSSVVFCDIEPANARRCATSDDKSSGIRFNAAAVALATGRRSAIALDDSPGALMRCNGEPEAVTLLGPFPDGAPACLNCGQVGPPPAPHADATAVCAARCVDVLARSGGLPPPDDPNDIDASALRYCEANARPSTNFLPVSTCFTGACSMGGMLDAGFVDPRWTSEPVIWRDFIDAAAGSGASNDLTRTVPSSTIFDAGAVSAQWIMRGDAYAEFSVAEINTSHVLGLTALPATCTFPCTDSDAGIANIGFAISLNRNGRIFILEGGTLVNGPDLNGSFGTYAAGERFRVNLVDRSDGTATVTYTRLPAPCTPGAACAETLIYSHTGPAPSYPFRVDTAFREAPATLTDVRLMRIR